MCGKRIELTVSFARGSLVASHDVIGASTHSSPYIVSAPDSLGMVLTAGRRSAKPHVRWLGRFGGVKAGCEFSAMRGRLVKVRCKGWVLCKINRYVVESGWLRLCNMFAMFTILVKAEIAHR